MCSAKNIEENMLDTRLASLSTFLQFQHHQRQMQLQQQQQLSQLQQHPHPHQRSQHLGFPSEAAQLVFPPSLGQLKPMFPAREVGSGNNVRKTPSPLRLPLQPVPVSAGAGTVPQGLFAGQALSSSDASGTSAAMAAMGFRPNLTPSPGPGEKHNDNVFQVCKLRCKT